LGVAGGLNLYQNVSNDPINLFDPYGLCPSPWWQGFWEGAKYGGMGELNAFGFGIPGRFGFGSDLEGSARGQFETGQFFGEIARDALIAAAMMKWSGPRTQPTRGGVKPTQLGKAGERAAGIKGPKTKYTIPGTDIKIIPDRVTRSLVTEVKNVKTLSYTKQLKNYKEFADKTGSTLELITRQNTSLSGSLKKAIDAGDIIHNTLPW